MDSLNIDFNGGFEEQEDNSFRILAKKVLDFPAPRNIEEQLRQNYQELETGEISNRVALFYAQLGKALNGDTRAFEIVRNTAGEKPSDKVELQKFDQSPFEIKIIK
ncbi:MAG: hypothetical protein IJ689_07480 [Alphaproteobacteria bacterium]|nr:hypothetical protein [Alphaproteobacteria bacterium]